VFFDIDADCVGLTKAMPWSLNRQSLDLLARSGTPLLVLGAPDAVALEQRDALRQAFSSDVIQQLFCEPLDWLQTNEPEHWRFGSKVSHLD
jgi:alpha-galactosidase